MSKVVSLEKKREEFYKIKSKREFEGYLKQLKDHELRYEADFILDNIDFRESDKDFLEKGAMLLDELAQRTQESSLSTKIEELSQALKLKIKQISSPTLH